MKIINDIELFDLITYQPFGGKQKQNVELNDKFYADNTLDKIFIKLTKKNNKKKGLTLTKICRKIK